MQELLDEANFAYGGKNDWQVRLQDQNTLAEVQVKVSKIHFEWLEFLMECDFLNNWLIKNEL